MVFTDKELRKMIAIHLFLTDTLECNIHAHISPEPNYYKEISITIMNEDKAKFAKQFRLMADFLEDK
jgi:hypothetical protein